MCAATAAGLTDEAAQLHHGVQPYTSLAPADMLRVAHSTSQGALLGRVVARGLDLDSLEVLQLPLWLAEGPFERMRSALLKQCLALFGTVPAEHRDGR